MDDELLFAPDPRIRWERAKKYARIRGDKLNEEITERFKDWPDYWWGTANAWLVFLGPSPGNSRPGHTIRKRDRLPTLGKANEHFRTQTGGGFWKRLREWTIQAYKLASVFPDDQEAALGLTLLANVLAEKEGNAANIAEEDFVKAMPTVVSNLELVKPRVIVPMYKKISMPLIEEFQRRGATIITGPKETPVPAINQRFPYYRPKYWSRETNFGPLLVAEAPQHPSKKNFYKPSMIDEYLANKIRAIVQEDSGKYLTDSTSLQSESTSHRSRPDKIKERAVSNRRVSVDIYVGGQRPENKVGSVDITEEQVKAAFADWNSRLYLPARRRWIRNKRDSKAVYDDEGKCYPPKKIMRIATREAVGELMGH